MRQWFRPARKLSVSSSVLVTLGLMFALVGSSRADEADERVKQYADFLIKLVVEKNEDALYQEFAPAIRASYPRDELLRTLNLVWEKHGPILSHEYRQRIDGETRFLKAGRSVVHLAYWYAVRTRSEAPQAFLIVKVTPGTDRLYTSGFDFQQVVGALPSFLEPRQP
jgi:hypothetical protein